MFGCIIPCFNIKGLNWEVMMGGIPSSGHGQLDQMMQTSEWLDPKQEETYNQMTQEHIERRQRKNGKQQRRQQKAAGGGGHRRRYVDEGHPRAGGEQLEEGKETRGEPRGGEEEECWVAEVDYGVSITFVSLASGGNAIVKIRFREDMFDASEAQKWWADNHDRVLNLYSVRRREASPAQSDSDQVASTPAQESSRAENTGTSDYNSAVSCSCSHTRSNASTAAGGGTGESSVISGKLVEWVVEDQPGVFVTVRTLSNGAKQIRRVELSREKFGEVKARVWWEENKERLQQQYT